MGQLVLVVLGWVHQTGLLVDYAAGTGSIVVGRGQVIGFPGIDGVEPLHPLLVQSVYLFTLLLTEGGEVALGQLLVLLQPQHRCIDGER